MAVPERTEKPMIERVSPRAPETPVAVETNDEVGFLAQTIEQMRTALRARDERMQMMLAGIAHEIRNPLTGIRTTVQFVGSKFKPRDPRREDLEDVIKELDRIEQIITGLLMFARPPAARPQPCDLHQVLEKTLDMIDLQLGDAHVTLHRDWAEDLPLVYADSDLTQQVFLNLCLNAIQAMPEGGELRVATGVRRYRTRRSMVDISFSDTGVGIPRDLIEKIFDPFFTTRSTGTGLGLPISVQIMREVGGVITARNNAGGGATFRVSFTVPAEPPGRPEE
jgi:signal transduction histidine kinase